MVAVYMNLSMIMGSINYHQAEDFLKENMGSALELSQFYFYVCSNSP